MKLDLTTPLLDRGGKEFTQGTPITTCKEVDGEIVEERSVEYSKVTLGRMLKSALLHKDVDNEKEIMERYNLYLKLEAGDEVELTEEEINTLRELSCQRFEIYYVGQIINLLTK